ncbi:MAG: sn-glycerol-3-phosphate ABC transporter ATP-binding protein UgpC [Azospirillum sp.]|nr:sn-glycerol-3-phosphate ABC transporter ATP-binding protein UgpC [Azospirillum sp.]
MASVEMQNLRKSYGTTEVIKGIDLAVREAEFLVLLGPSGCGKSTLLRLVAGLETIDAGEITIAGRVVNRLEPKDRDIAMVFQNYALYPHMSVFDNMAYGLRLRGLSRGEIAQRVARTADLLELQPFLGRKPRQLSGGQRQRVAMGRAIVREPAVFLFDEPLSNLDARLRTQMRIEIKRLQARLGVTSLYVTHDQVEAMTLADRVAVLDRGAIEQLGAPLEIYRRPETLFVAGFIGAPPMNFLNARVAPGGSAVVLDAGPALPLAAPLPDQAGRPVRLGMRPEHLILAEAGSTVAGSTVDVSVELVEALGADCVVHTRLDASGEPLLVRRPGAPTSRCGDRLRLSAEPEALHLFDPATGRRCN